jgi:hypothetical protein
LTPTARLFGAPTLVPLALLDTGNPESWRFWKSFDSPNGALLLHLHLHLHLHLLGACSIQVRTSSSSALNMLKLIDKFEKPCRSITIKLSSDHIGDWGGSLQSNRVQTRGGRRSGELRAVGELGSAELLSKLHGGAPPSVCARRRRRRSGCYGEGETKSGRRLTGEVTDRAWLCYYGRISRAS